MERKLAHVEVISDIRPIDGADKIEVCTVLGWHCVIAKKDKFKVGDKVIYIEVDSVVPDIPMFEFLRDRKFRVRTIKLRGQVSQGLIIPLLDQSKKVGVDMTDELSIRKYLTPTEAQEIIEDEERLKRDRNRLRKFMMRYSWFRRIFLSRTRRSGWPYWVPKTDEDRIQNMPHVLTQFADYEVFITEKVDYQSVTFTSKKVPRFNSTIPWIHSLWMKTQFVVCSRNLTTNDKNSLYWQIAIKYGLERICKIYPGIIIQGEQGSSKVQGNKYKITDPTMWIFNIIAPDKGFLSPPDINLFCKAHNLKAVPYIGKHKMSAIGATVDEWVECAKGKSLINPDIHREGIVVRVVKNGQKLLSFKVINPDFLLHYEN